MQRKITWLLSLVAVGLLGFVCAGRDARPWPGPQWEYGVYRSFAGHFLWQDDQTDIRADGIPAFAARIGLRANAEADMVETAFLNHFGRQGWELVFVQMPNDTTGGWAYWFKRPRYGAGD
jgi:hypothetical protein